MPNGQPSQLANLKPYQPGQSGNPGGRPKGVVYPAEHMRGMTGMTVEEIQRIKDDPQEPASRRIAAGMYLDAFHGDTARARKDATAELCDRTSGRPCQSLEVIAEKPEKSVEELLDDLKRRHGLMQASPPALPADS